MGSTDWSTLIEAAAAEGFSNELLPDGPYELQIAHVKVGKSQGGKPQIGVRFKVLSGPHAGASFWDNLTLSLESSKAMAVFFRKALEYGATVEQFKSGAGVEEIAAAFANKVGGATVGQRDWNGRLSNVVLKFKATEGAAAPAALAPAGNIQTVQAVPVVQAPVIPTGTHIGPSF